jgi:hypothetical protein
MSEPSGPPKITTNAPLYTFGTIVLFVMAVVVLIVTNHADESGLFLALAISTLPSLVGSLFAERASRDIRNGVVVEQTRQGAAQAIEEKGVVVRQGPVVNAQIAALHALVEDMARKQTQQIDDAT